MKSHIRLLLVDDHPVVRWGISSCLERVDEITVVGEAANGLEALKKAGELLPDLVLMDLEMPHMDGLAVAKALHKEFPQIKVLILSMHTRTDIRSILESGVRGFVLKQAPPEELLRAIEGVHKGETCFSPDMARMALTQFIKPCAFAPLGLLTNRERDVLALIAEGLINKEIASQLGIGTRTVETHRDHIIRKLNIHSTAGLTKFAISQGLISVQQELRCA